MTDAERQAEAQYAAKGARAAVAQGEPGDGASAAAPEEKRRRRRVQLNVERPLPQAEADASLSSSAEDSDEDLNAEDDGNAMSKPSGPLPAVRIGPSGERLAAEAAAASRRAEGMQSAHELMRRVRDLKPEWTKDTVQVNRTPEIKAVRIGLPVVREEYRVRTRGD